MSAAHAPNGAPVPYAGTSCPRDGSTAPIGRRESRLVTQTTHADRIPVAFGAPGLGPSRTSTRRRTHVNGTIIKTLTSCGWRGGRPAAVLAALALALSVGATAGAAHADTATDGISIDAGGAGYGSFVADAYYSDNTLTTSIPSTEASDPNFRTVANPIPAQVWDTQRYLATTYAIPGFTAGGSYQVRLYFMDWYFTRPGQREFDVSINGTQVLTNFDVIATADAAGADGQEAFGVEEDFTATADSTGTITVDFTLGAANQPLINAIAVVPTGS
jgi:hypothetical protein